MNGFTGGEMSEHANISLVRQIGQAIQTGHLTSVENVVADDFAWHYFNPRLPDLAGDYHGLSGVESFFSKLAEHSGGTFKMQPVSAQHIGDELVVTHGRVELTIQERHIETDVVVVWRV